MTQLWWDGSLTTTSPNYRQEVEHLEGWCRQNNLCINVKKTKEMIVDFRRGRHLPSPLYIGGTAVEVVSSFRRLRRARAGELSPDLLLQMCGGERPCPPASSCGTAAARQRQRRRLCRG
ncbi:hypothetical protein L3Q82_024478, partial [Scortum barcoo]